MQALQDIIINKIVSGIIKEDEWNEEKPIEYYKTEIKKKCSFELYNIILYKLTLIYRHNVVRKNIKDKFSMIEKSYKIVDSYCDGYTRLGHYDYVEDIWCICQNGVDGYDYEIRSQIRSFKNRYLEKLVFKGLKNGKIKIRVHESLLINANEIIILLD
ncbi:hypothetical protein CPAV1605_512 [seawater metagenome]|uniref:Uncharacterized protein n=1 Tax=seawater metagenome TaxID=1561972 RepID=A0A5E8CI83_9ZZZZ